MRDTHSLRLVTLVTLLISLSCSSNVFAQRNLSKWVERGEYTNRLVYTPDAQGDHIPDFSDVGYRGGRENFPAVPSTFILSPVKGDNTPQIQAAIDQVAAMPIGANGMRGAVHLRAGTYRIDGQLNINHSGILLRGSGYGVGGTRLQATGTDRRTIIQIEGSGQRDFFGSKRSFIDKVVPVGSRSFRLNSHSNFEVGDQVRVSFPAFSDWLNVIGMDVPGIDWSSSSNFIRFDRTITRIEGERVFVDAPLTNAFELEYGTGKVQEFIWPERIENVGVRNMDIWSSWTSFEDEDHPWDAIFIDKAKHVHILAVNCLFFARSAIVTGADAKWVTIQRCRFAHPRSEVDGGRRYPFDLGGQLELVTLSRAYDARHDFIVSNQRAPGPHVFHHSKAFGALSESGPHQRWTNGILFDRIWSDSNTLSARNRGDFGTGQGWSGANCVFFNCEATGFIVQSPPTAQNWLIGSIGPIINDETFGPQPPGYYDANGKFVFSIPSLYVAQRNEVRKLADGRIVNHRDYLYGDVDDFNYDVDGVDDEFVDPSWISEVESQSGFPVTGFDDLTTGTSPAMSLVFEVDPGESVIHGWVSYAIRKKANDKSLFEFARIHVGDANGPALSESLYGLSHTETYTGTIQLGNILHPNTVGDVNAGRIDLQFSEGVAVDWVKLHLTTSK